MSGGACAGWLAGNASADTAGAGASAAVEVLPVAAFAPVAPAPAVAGSPDAAAPGGCSGADEGATAAVAGVVNADVTRAGAEGPGDITAVAGVFTWAGVAGVAETAGGCTTAAGVTGATADSAGGVAGGVKVMTAPAFPPIVVPEIAVAAVAAAASTF